MGFWENSFLAKRRNEWLRDISKVQYYAGSTWYNAQVNYLGIVGNKLVIKFQSTDSLALTITKIRVLDKDGVVAGSATGSIIKKSTQAMYYVIEMEIAEAVAASE